MNRLSLFPLLLAGALSHVGRDVVLIHNDLERDAYMPVHPPAAWRRPAYRTPSTARGAEFAAAADAKRARKAARRMELAA